MELLLTILFWVVAIIGGLIALPFAIGLVLMAFGIVAFIALAIFFGSLITTITIGVFLADLVRPVVTWFRRTAGCQ